MQGHIDSISNGYIFGWAKLNGYDHSVNIEITINGKVVCDRYLANEMRQDVLDSNIGHGRYGFSYLIPNDIFLDGQVSVSVKAADWPSEQIHHIFEITDYFRPEEDEGYLHTIAEKMSLDCDIVIDETSNNMIRGWSVDKNDRSSIFHLKVLINGSFFSDCMNNITRNDLKHKNISGGLGGFSTFIPLDCLDVGNHEITVVAPDGTSKSRTISISDRKNYDNNFIFPVIRRNVTIIVPIFNAYDDLVSCIDRLVEYTRSPFEILMIDDASTDSRIRSALEGISSHPRFRILYNKENLGFTKTVNVGLAEAGRNDVIILNSDARVTPGWIEGLLMAAQSRPQVATVTAMSDRAGAFSAPDIGNENTLPNGVDEITYARAFRRHSMGLYPIVPTGNGFCMFINRDCIDQVGALDADAFPRGYGEENDFCMRAWRAGWHNVIDDRTYVFFLLNKTVATEKIDLMREGRAIVDDRYPEYKSLISTFTDSSKINMARYRAKLAIEHCRTHPVMPLRILFVISTQTGGTPQTNRDLMRGLSGDVDGWVLRCDSKIIELSHMEGDTLNIHFSYELQDPIEPISHISNEYDSIVSQWILGIDPDIVHIRHLGWHSVSLPSIVKYLGKKSVFSFHDYYTLCPTIKLLDENKTFCGGTCTASAGQCSVELWPQEAFPELKHKWVHIWRNRFAEALAHCNAFVTTSQSARARILEHMPNLAPDRISVIPHGRDFQQFARMALPPRHGEPVRILVPGNINEAKGLEIILDLLEEDRAGLLEFHVVGKVASSNRGEHPRLIKHGEYSRDNFSDIVRPIQPHMGAIFSIWDETYCHTLTELWSIGVPSIVFDYENVASRVRASGAGWVMDHDDIPKLYRNILHAAFDGDGLQQIYQSLYDWQSGDGLTNSVSFMAAAYMDVYRAVSRDIPLSAAPRTKKIGILRALPTGRDHKGSFVRNRISERTRNAIGRHLSYVPMTPASLLTSMWSNAIDGVVIEDRAMPDTMKEDFVRAAREKTVPYILDITTACDSDAPVVRHASLVTVLYHTHKDILTGYNQNISVLRDKIAGYSSLPESNNCGLETDDIPAVYIGGRVDDLKMILPALRAVADVRPTFRLKVIGMPEYLVEEIDSEWLQRIDIPPEVRTSHDLLAWLAPSSLFSFGIAPCAQAEWPRAASMEILTYAALGLSVLASDIEDHRILAEGAPALKLLPDDVEAWLLALLGQVDLAMENREAGVEMRRWALQNHNMDATLPAFDDLVQSILGTEHRHFAL